VIKLLGLLQKELRQSALTFGVIVTVTLVAAAAILYGQPLARLKGSGLHLASYVMMIFLPLGCHGLAGSMIGGEFRHKTQIFLEGLPLPRWQMLCVKFFMGLAATTALVWLLIAAAWLKGRHAESMTPNFAALLLTKSACWASLVWALSFTLAFTGRYRLPCLLFLVLGLLGMHSEGFDVAKHGPLALLNASFGYERHSWPLDDLVITLGSALIIAALGFGLGSARHASIAAMLAEKMSNQERLMFSLLGSTALLGFGLTQQARVKTQPLYLPGSVDWAKNAVSVHLAAAVEDPTHEELEALQRWSEVLGGFLNETAVWLRRDHFPPVHVVHRRDYDASRLEWQSLDTRQGVLVRLNVLKKDPVEVELLEELLSHVLHAALHDRLKIKGDSAGWVLDGFAYLWPRKQQPMQEPVRSAEALSPENLEAWLKVRKAVGEKEARRIASVALSCIAEAGQEPYRDFVAAILGREVSHHSGALIQEWWHPSASLLRQLTGLEWRQLAERWSQKLKNQPQLGERMNRP
jgi:hypothetical protein